MRPGGAGDRLFEMFFLQVLLIAWGLGDDHQSGPVIARSRQGMVPGLGQVASLAGSDSFIEDAESIVHSVLPDSARFILHEKVIPASRATDTNPDNA